MSERTAERPPVVAESDIRYAVEADIVVVGGGHAGVQCALAAAEGGASVAVVERQKEETMRWTGEQIGTVNANYLIERGFGPYDETAIINEFFRCSGFRANPALLALFVYNSGEMLDHMISLVDAQDDLLDPDQANIHQAWGDPVYPVEIGGCRSWACTLQFRGKLVTERPEKAIPVNANSRLSDFERYALDRSVALGAKWYFGHQASYLETENGSVTGLISALPEGGYARFRAGNAVVLCTGDAYGDSGNRMGVWAGGYILDNLEDSHMPCEVARSFGRTPFLMLNREGMRFTDESSPYALGPAIARQPLGLVTAVTDANWLEQVRRQGIQHGCPDFGMPAYIEQCAEDMSHVLEHGRQGYGVRSASHSERETYPVFGAQTLEELAEILGYEGEAAERFLQSIERYNALCRSGKDRDFGKDPKTLLPIETPPFYGFRENNTRRGTATPTPPKGLATDNRLCVLNTDGNPIRGLYAAGNCLGGRYAVNYPTPMGGNMIGMAMTHGRWLGKQLTGQ